MFLFTARMICGCFSDIVIIDTIIILGLLLTLCCQSSIETNDVLDVEFVSFYFQGHWLW